MLLVVSGMRLAKHLLLPYASAKSDTLKEELRKKLNIDTLRDRESTLLPLAQIHLGQGIVHQEHTL